MDLMPARASIVGSLLPLGWLSLYIQWWGCRCNPFFAMQAVLCATGVAQIVVDWSGCFPMCVCVLVLSLVSRRLLLLPKLWPQRDWTIVGGVLLPLLSDGDKRKCNGGLLAFAVASVAHIVKAARVVDVIWCVNLAVVVHTLVYRLVVHCSWPLRSTNVRPTHVRNRALLTKPLCMPTRLEKGKTPGDMDTCLFEHMTK